MTENLLRTLQKQMTSAMEHREKHMKGYIAAASDKETQKHLSSWSYWSGRYDAILQLVQSMKAGAV